MWGCIDLDDLEVDEYFVFLFFILLGLFPTAVFVIGKFIKRLDYSIILAVVLFFALYGIIRYILGRRKSTGAE